MRLVNEIALAVPPDRLFAALLDVENVVPCIPGAELDRVEGDVYHASVKLKVGPIAVAYKGTVRFVDVDEADRTAVMRAQGREARGQGKADATITAKVVGSGSQSTLTMETDLGIRGRVAQFGRNVMNEVAQNLMDQFAENLRRQIASVEEGGPQPEPEAPAGPGGREAARVEESDRGRAPEAEVGGAEIDPLLLLRPLAARATPLLVTLLVGLALGLLLGRGRNRPLDPRRRGGDAPPQLDEVPPMTEIIPSTGWSSPSRR